MQSFGERLEIRNARPLLSVFFRSTILSSSMNAVLGATATPEKRRTDWLLYISAGLLLLIGLLTLWSATGGGSEFKKQLVWLVVGLPFAVLFYKVDPRFWALYSRTLYVLTLLLLIMPWLPGFKYVINDANRWISFGAFQFQPSEPAKLLMILTFADFLARWRSQLRTVRGLAISFLHVCIAFALVLVQPDLGTSLVFIALWLGMSLVARQRLRLIALALVAGCMLFLGAWKVGVLKDYQVARVADLVRGGGYQTKIAINAIGSGKGIGSGYNKGPMKESGLVPVQESDFIFTVIAEETGFVGSVLTILAFAFFLWRVWLVSLNSTVPLFKYMAAGVFVVFAFHTIVNLFMVVALFPVVGVPLPFVSYGGSKMVLLFAMLGLLFNIRNRERVLAF